MNLIATIQELGGILTWIFHTPARRVRTRGLQVCISPLGGREPSRGVLSPIQSQSAPCILIHPFRSADCPNPQRMASQNNFGIRSPCPPWARPLRVGTTRAPINLQSCQIFALAFALVLGFQALAGDGTNPVAPATGRDFYNAGTRLLAARKFADAEKMFQAALAAQDDSVQPKALFNVGHTRFASGLERLQQGPDAQKAATRGSAALAAGEHALRQSESALAENNLSGMMDAYLEGRGARRELREAQKAVAAAMETYGKTLEQWLRAADDFKSAAELNPADTQRGA